MIPPEKGAAVTLGLNETFGVTEFEDIRDLTERPGSNRAFRIIVGGSAYLLRINTRAGDMIRHFTCMQAAADAGLAPAVRYASAEDRISITDFVEAVPLRAPDALVRIPAALRTLRRQRDGLRDALVALGADVDGASPATLASNA